MRRNATGEYPRFGRLRPGSTSLMAALLCLSSTAAAAQPTAVPEAQPATILNSVQWSVTAKSNGQRYRIYVSKPSTPPPPGGYPVFYMLDGDGYFGIGASQLRMRAGFELRPALVVAIGSASDDMKQIVPDRWRDFTPSQPVGEDVTSLLKAGFVLPAFGGAEAFHHFLVDELRPMLAAAYPIDLKDQSIFGHSLGGLFVLYSLFEHPTAYRTFVAASPSIYWGGSAVLRNEQAFRQQVERGEIAPRVLVMVGGDESDPDKVGAPPGTKREELAKMLADKAMVGNAERLGARLKAIRGTAGYKAESIVFPEESHTSVTAVSVSRGMTFALGKRD